MISLNQMPASGAPKATCLGGAVNTETEAAYSNISTASTLVGGNGTCLRGTISTGDLITLK